MGQLTALRSDVNNHQYNEVTVLLIILTRAKSLLSPVVLTSQFEWQMTSVPCTHTLLNRIGSVVWRGWGGLKGIKGVRGGANKMNDNAVMDGGDGTRTKERGAGERTGLSLISSALTYIMHGYICRHVRTLPGSEAFKERRGCVWNGSRATRVGVWLTYRYRTDWRDAK